MNRFWGSRSVDDGRLCLDVSEVIEIWTQYSSFWWFYCIPSRESFGAQRHMVRPDGEAKSLSAFEEIYTESLVWLVVPSNQICTALRPFRVGRPSG